MTDSLTLDDLPQPEAETTVRPDDLHVDGDNPNSQNDAMFGLLCENLRRKGWLGNAIVADTDGCIADGEHRWRAAQEIGLEEVPVKFYDIDDAERRLWRQELNKISGVHDTKRDALEYDHLLEAGMVDDVQALTTAADEDLDELLPQIKLQGEQSPDYEYDPEHDVYFEDCIDGMRQHLDDDSVDMVFTSPPYNVEKDKGGTRETDVVTYEDDKDPDEFRSFLGEVFDEIARVVKPDGHVFVNIQNDNRDGTIDPPYWVTDRMPLPWRSYVVWSKNAVPHGSMGANRRGRFYMDWEPVYHFSADPRELHGTRNFGVWDCGVVRGNELSDTSVHPAPFPIELVEEALSATTSEGDVILDPFMGSGTTAVAAILNCREYIGFELDEEGAYRPIIERRIGEAERQVQSQQNADPEAKE